MRRAGRYWPALVLLAGLTCPLILSTWYTFNKQRAALEHAYHLELEQMTTVLANGMREPIWNLSPMLGRALLDSVMGDARVLSVQITSLAEGMFLQAERIPRPESRPLRFARPVTRGDREIGEVVLEADASIVSAQLDDRWSEIYALGVLQGLLGLGVVGFVYWALRRQERDEALREMNRRLSEEVQARADALQEANEELRRQENLATLGRLTATVSHELRNPLGTISNSMEMISRLVRDGEERPPDRETVLRALARARRNIARCSRIADDLLGFARADSVSREPTDIDAWLGDLLAEFEIPEGISLDTRLRAGVTIGFDRERLRRAVSNLLGNAVQAMTDDAAGTSQGRLTVTSEANGERVELRVRDSGSGIAPELSEQIFEPLFSTRNFGFGLGLPLVKQTLAQHGGDVEVVDSREGAEFLVWLPLDDAPPARPPA